MSARPSIHVWVALVLVLSGTASAQPQDPQGDQEETTPPAPPQEPTPPPAPVEPPPPAAPDTLAPAPGGEGSGEISLEDWNRDDWMLVQPKTSLLVLDGYLRFRGDMFQRFDFGNQTATEVSNGNPSPRYPRTNDGEADFTGTNMRLRLEPQINISDDVHIIATFDVFDNLVLGSTPRVLRAEAGQTPTHVLARSQTFSNDFFIAKRVWARMTALNEQVELRIGRMPDHFGLGMFANSGDCLNCSYGNIADRVSLAFKAADHVFVGMYDFVSSGPNFLPFGDGQPVDAATWDDVDQISLRIMKADAPVDIEERVLAGDTVLNYGVWGAWKRQYRDFPASFYDENGEFIESELFGDNDLDERRNANLFTVDAYARLYSGGMTLSLEATGLSGSFRDRNIPNEAGETGEQQKTTILQGGAALEAAYRFAGEYRGTELSLKTGAASGDRAPGFGALNYANTQRQTGDLKLNNFNFNPDYQLDLILFRNIIGTVTDAWYARPAIAYTFDNNITGSFAAIYSQAMKRRSTPGRELPLGLELDAELAYGGTKTPEGGSVAASLAGGLLFPFGGFRNDALGEDATADNAPDPGGSFAWTIQARLYLTF